jgi:hypothetical protein
MKPTHSMTRKWTPIYANKDGREKPSTADEHRFTQIREMELWTNR